MSLEDQGKAGRKFFIPLDPQDKRGIAVVASSPIGGSPKRRRVSLWQCRRVSCPASSAVNPFYCLQTKKHLNRESYLVLRANQKGPEVASKKSVRKMVKFPNLLFMKNL